MDTQAPTPKPSLLRNLWMNEPIFRWATVILTVVGIIIATLQVIPAKADTPVPSAVVEREALPSFFEGNIGELDEHRMCMFLQQNKDSIYGLYWYCKWAPFAEKFEVRGRIHGDTLLVEARIVGWPTWETFRGQRTVDDAFEGVWIAHDGCRRLPFRIRPSKRDMLDLMHHG